MSIEGPYTGPELKELRRRAMLTQRDVVKMTGICESTIWNVEVGRTKPQAATLEKMLALYNDRIGQLRDKFKNLYGKTQVRRAPGVTICQK